MKTKANPYTLTIALLGAIKLVTDAFGYHIFEDNQIETLANGIAALIAVMGVIINHFKQ